MIRPTPDLPGEVNPRELNKPGLKFKEGDKTMSKRKTVWNKEQLLTYIKEKQKTIQEELVRLVNTHEDDRYQRADNISDAILELVNAHVDLALKEAYKADNEIYKVINKHASKIEGLLEDMRELKKEEKPEFEPGDRVNVLIEGHAFPFNNPPYTIKDTREQRGAIMYKVIDDLGYPNWIRGTNLVPISEAKPEPKELQPKFKPGNLVRVERTLDEFDKGNWENPPYKVYNVSWNKFGEDAQYRLEDDHSRRIWVPEEYVKGWPEMRDVSHDDMVRLSLLSIMEMELARDKGNYTSKNKRLIQEFLDHCAEKYGLKKAK